MSTPIGEKLAQLIRSIQRGQISFDEFSSKFSDVYIEEDEPELDDFESSLYGAIHEKLEWTTKAPPAGDRAVGWLDPAEFMKWLSELDPLRASVTPK